MTNPYLSLYLLVREIVSDIKWMVGILLFFKGTSEMSDQAYVQFPAITQAADFFFPLTKSY